MLASRFFSVVVEQVDRSTRARPYRTQDENVNFLTVLYIMAGALAATFSARAVMLDPAQLGQWLLYLSWLSLGIAIAALIGVQARPDRIAGEGYAVAIGIVGYAIIVTMQYLTFMLSNIVLFSQLNFYFAILAPISETFFFTVSLYRFIRVALPALSWLFSNLISSITFALYHYFVYGLDPMTLIILFFGNTVLNYTFELTKNPAAPITAHLLVNISPYWLDIATFVVGFWWIFMIPVFLTIFCIVCGGTRR